MAAAEAAHFDNDDATASTYLSDIVDRAETDGLHDLAARAVLMQARVRNTSGAAAWRSRTDSSKLVLIAQSATSTTERAQAFELLAEIASSAGRLDEASRWAGQAIGELDATVDIRTKILAYGARGYARLAALDLPGANDDYTRALQLSESNADGWLRCVMATRLAYVHHPAGRLNRAGELARGVVDLASARRDFTNEGLCEAILAQVATVRGDFAALELHASRARANGVRSGYPLVLFVLYPALLFAAHSRGDEGALRAALVDWRAEQPDMERTIDRYAALLGGERAHPSRPPRRTQMALGLACMELETAGAVADDGTLDELALAHDAGVEFAFTWPASIGSPPTAGQSGCAKSRTCPRPPPERCSASACASSCSLSCPADRQSQ